MHPSFENLCALYRESLRDLDAGATQRHPLGDPCRWNSQQVVEHMTLTFRLSAQMLRGRLEKGQATKARVKLWQWGPRITLLRLGYFPRNIKAPKEVAPQGLVPANGTALADDFRAALGEVDGVLDEAEAAFGTGRRLANHFALGPLAATDWRRFHLLHGHHHLKQLARIRAANR